MAIKVTRDMLQDKYEWEASGGSDPDKIKIDARLFNRREGYEVVPMIQKVVDHFGWETEADVQRIEEAIRDELPGSIRGRHNVREWLIENLS